VESVNLMQKQFSKPLFVSRELGENFELMDEVYGILSVSPGCCKELSVLVLSHL